MNAPLVLDLVTSLAVGSVGALGVVRDRQVRLLRRALTDARYAATHDRLTGLANRAGLAAAWPMLSDARATVAVIDLDDFKPVNDQHGHAAGDMVLAEVGRRLAGTVDGLAARLGGDEFAAVLRAEPVTTARRLIGLLAEPVILDHGATVKITASVGLARPGEPDLSTALAQADAAMYRAKALGIGVDLTDIAVYDRVRDDHTAPADEPRPIVRTRDLEHVPAFVGPMSSSSAAPAPEASYRRPLEMTWRTDR